MIVPVYKVVLKFDRKKISPPNMSDLMVKLRTIPKINFWHISEFPTIEGYFETQEEAEKVEKDILNILASFKIKQVTSKFKSVKSYLEIIVEK